MKFLASFCISTVQILCRQYVIIFKHIQAYSSISKHIQAHPSILRFISNILHILKSLIQVTTPYFRITTILPSCAFTRI